MLMHSLYCLLDELTNEAAALLPFSHLLGLFISIINITNHKTSCGQSICISIVYHSNNNNTQQH